LDDTSKGESIQNPVLASQHDLFFLSLEEKASFPSLHKKARALAQAFG
jgi:hypothetical protein